MTMGWLIAFAVLVLVAAALSGARCPRLWLVLTLAGTATLFRGILAEAFGLSITVTVARRAIA